MTFPPSYSIIQQKRHAENTLVCSDQSLLILLVLSISPVSWLCPLHVNTWTTGLHEDSNRVNLLSYLSSCNRTMYKDETSSGSLLRVVKGKTARTFFHVATVSLVACRLGQFPLHLLFLFFFPFESIGLDPKAKFNVFCPSVIL